MNPIEPSQETVLPIESFVWRINAERDYYVVTLSVDEKLMQQYGLITLAVRAMGNVLLFLDADQDDPIP